MMVRRKKGIASGTIESIRYLSKPEGYKGWMPRYLRQDYDMGRSATYPERMSWLKFVLGKIRRVK